MSRFRKPHERPQVYMVLAQIKGFRNKMEFYTAVSFDDAREKAKLDFEGPWKFYIQDDTGEVRMDPYFDLEWEEP